jgi:hypothetical protein
MFDEGEGATAGGRFRKAEMIVGDLARLEEAVVRRRHSTGRHAIVVQRRSSAVVNNRGGDAAPGTRNISVTRTP